MFQKIISAICICVAPLSLLALYCSLLLLYQYAGQCYGLSDTRSRYPVYRSKDPKQDLRWALIASTISIAVLVVSWSTIWWAFNNR
jgi:hypothetical protein